jgi:hypothetical protein
MHIKGVAMLSQAERPEIQTTICELFHCQTQIAKLCDIGYDPTKGISGIELSGFWNGWRTFCASRDPTRETCPQHRLPTTHTVDDLPQCGAIANRV